MTEASPAFVKSPSKVTTGGNADACGSGRIGTAGRRVVVAPCPAPLRYAEYSAGGFAGPRRSSEGVSRLPEPSMIRLVKPLSLAHS